MQGVSCRPKQAIVPQQEEGARSVLFTCLACLLIDDRDDPTGPLESGIVRQLGRRTTSRDASGERKVLYCWLGKASTCGAISSSPAQKEGVFSTSGPRSSSQSASAQLRTSERLVDLEIHQQFSKDVGKKYDLVYQGHTTDIQLTTTLTAYIDSKT